MFFSLNSHAQQQKNLRYFDALHGMTNRKIIGNSIEENFVFDTENVSDTYFSYAYPNHNAQYDVKILKIAQDREIALSAYIECKKVCETTLLQAWEFQSENLIDISQELLPHKYDSIIKSKMHIICEDKKNISDTISVGFWVDFPKTNGEIRLGYMIFSKGEQIKFTPFFKLLYDDKKKKFIFIDI